MIYKFSTPSCGMCKNLSTMLSKQNIPFTEVDCTDDENKPIVAKFNVSSVPTVVCIKGNDTAIYRNYGEIIKNLDIIRNYAD